MIDYNPLWATVQAKDVTQYKLLQAGLDHKTLDPLQKHHPFGFGKYLQYYWLHTK